MNVPRRTEPTTPRRAAIEASVLAATEDLLREGSSYSELNIERIATRAGISRTAFYFYFRDKRELLVRVTEGVTDLLFEAADRWWSDEGDGRAELPAALRSIAALWEEHLALLGAVVEASGYDAELAGFWRGLVERFIQATRRRVEAEQARGAVADGLDAERVAFALVWMTERSLFQHLMAGRDGGPDELVDALAAVWRGALYGH